MIKQLRILETIKILLLHPIKLLNLLQVLFSYLFLKGRLWGIPPILILEPTTNCQLKCPLCILQKDDFTRKNIQMDKKLVKKILKECGNKLLIALVYNQGEPLLHPEYNNIIKLLKSYNIFVKVSTNGNHKKDISKEIIDSGLDHIIFDIDGDTQEIYEKYRTGGSLNTVLSNIKNLSLAKKETKAKNPFIEVRMIAMKHNIDRVDKVKSLIDNLGIDSFTIKKCMIRKEEEFPEAMSFIPETFNRLDSKTPRSCFYPWIYFCVLADGKVSPCCYDEKGEFIFGDTKINSLPEILKNPEFDKLRYSIKKDSQKVPMCKTCDIEGEFYTSYEEFKNTFSKSSL